MNIIKKLVWLVVFIPATAQAQYYGVTPSTATGRATMRLSGQELVYASSSTTSPSIILQGNGGRITATGGITVSSGTILGPFSVQGVAAFANLLNANGGVSASTISASTVTALAILAGSGTIGSDSNILSFYNAGPTYGIGINAAAVFNSRLKILAQSGYAITMQNIAVGPAAGNGTLYEVNTDASLNLGNTTSESQVLTSPLSANSTAAQQFVARMATSNTTADYQRFVGNNGTSSYTLGGFNNAKNFYTPYGISASTITASSATLTGNVSIGTTTAQTRLNVTGGDIRVQGDSSGFGTVPTSGEGLEIAYDSVNHYAWFGAYNRTTAAYTGNYVDGSTMGLNYYSKGPVIIGGNTSAPGLALTYGVSAATATVTGPITLGGITYTMPSTLGGPGQFLMLASTSTSAATMSFGSPSGSGDVLTTGNNTMTGTNTFSSAIVANGGITFPDGYAETTAGYQLYSSSHTSCTNGGVGGVTSLTVSIPLASNRIVINAQQYTTAGYYYLTVGSYTSGYRYSNLSWTTGTTASNSASAAYIPITNGTVSTTTGFLYAVLDEQYAGWIGGARAMHVMGQYTTYNSSSLPETGMIGGMTGGIGNTVTITVSAGKFCGSVDVYALNGSRSGY